MTAVIAAQGSNPEVRVVARDYDIHALVAAPPLSDRALQGRALWLQRCAFCHDGVGTPTYRTMGPWIDADRVQALGEERVRATIADRSTRMPGFKYALDRDDVDHLLTFLQSIGPEHKPTADQLAGKTPPLPGGATPRSADAPVTADARMSGTITSQGRPLDGVAVSAHAPGTTITTSVYTDERGEYVFPPLRSGRYELWAQAVGYATGRATVSLDAARPTRQTLPVVPVRDFSRQLSGVEWYDALPGDTPEHRRMKQVLHVTCSDCHSLAVVLQNRFDEAGWRAVIKAMEESSHLGWTGRLDPPTDQLGFLAGIMRHHREDLVKYLVEMRGPGPSPMKLAPPPRPRGDAARVVITEYDIPIGERENELAWYNGSDWSQGPAVGMHGIVGVHDAVVDGAGNVWLSEARTTFETNRTYTKLDPRTGRMTAVTMVGGSGRIMFTEQVAQDQQHNIWSQFDYASLGRFDPGSLLFALFSPPRAMGGLMNASDLDPQGHVWTNGRNGSVRFDPATGTFHLYQQRTPADGSTYGVAADGEGNGWWSQFVADYVTKADVKTGERFEIPMRDPDYEKRRALMTPADLAFYDAAGAQSWGGYPVGPTPWASAPRRLSADQKGNTVWVPNWAGETLAKIDIHTLKVTYYPLPIHGHPYDTHVDAAHNVWTDVPLGDAIVKFDPKTEQWTVYQLPSRGCGSRHLGMDTVRGELWLPCDQSSRVARVQFRSAGEIAAQEGSR
jgi:streptogramin lyase/mono/diheme cytochrome c family protein